MAHEVGVKEVLLHSQEKVQPRLPHTHFCMEIEDSACASSPKVMNLCVYFNLKCWWNWNTQPYFVFLMSICRKSWSIISEKLCFCLFAIGLL